MVLSFFKKTAVKRQKYAKAGNVVAVLLCLLLIPGGVHADDDAPSKKLPRFVTLGKDEVFVRTGPALQYPIKWVYSKRGLPVEIIREYETWRQVRDIDGTDGWVHHAMLSGYRNAIIKSKSDVTLLKKPDPGAAPVVRLESGVVVTLDECEAAWCRVGISGFRGWTLRSNLWGVDGSEQIK